jgi:biopolymer transport protein TolR
MTSSGVPPRSEINITPLIDVMLVLLIIFMVVTPTAQRSVDTSIPHEATEGGGTPPETLVLSLDRDGPQLNGLRVPMEMLEAHCRELFLTRSDKTLFVRAEGDVRYGTVVLAMDAAKGGGVERIGIITDKPASRTGAPREEER